MILQNEAMYENPFIVNEIESSIENGKVKIVARQQKNNQKLHEQKFYYTRGGLSCLIGSLMAIEQKMNEREG